MVRVEVDGYEATVKFKIGYMPITKSERKALGEPENWIQMPSARELAQEGICLTSLLYSANSHELGWYHTELSILNDKLKGKLKKLQKHPLSNQKAFLLPGTRYGTCRLRLDLDESHRVIWRLRHQSLTVD